MQLTKKHLQINHQDWIDIDLHIGPTGTLLGKLTSNLDTFDLPDAGSTSCCVEDKLYAAATDMLEAIILAHACAGVDVENAAYIAGIDQAIAEIVNRFG